MNLDEARAARRERDWPRLYALLAGTDGLDADDLVLLSEASWWLGRIDESLDAGERAFQAHLDDGQRDAAAMCAIEQAVALLLRGDETRGSGWLGRAQRVLEDLPERPAHGYLLYLTEVEGALDGGDLAAVAEAARRVREIGQRHDDRHLVAAGVVGEGRALIKLGQVEQGERRLDEAMLTVLHEDLEPEWAGDVYCHIMAACHELADIERAARWTAATESWLDEQAAAVMFTGICRVHRSEVLETVGDWDRAEQVAARVIDDLADIHVSSVAEAHYRIGQLCRLRGDLDGAEAAYRRARELGRDPQPGLALLRLAQHRPDVARSGLDAALRAEPTDRLARARLRTAQVEVALAAGDPALAAEACAELEDAAATFGTSGLEAAALHWRGAVSLGEGRAEHALAALRAACRRWHDADAPYEAARACVLLGRAYRALGDQDAAAAELDAAIATFERLGADTDRRAAEQLVGSRSLPGGMTEREAEVLALVARGGTNREVAEQLVLSEKTIARHLSNIFAKLGVATRTEAAAVAFEHGLARPGRG